jgi:hypothetical protein
MMKTGEILQTPYKTVESISEQTTKKGIEVLEKIP